MSEVPQPETPKKKKNPSGLALFWAELKRRKVRRVAVTYAVVAWLIIQIASTTFESFGIPEWAFRFVVAVLVLCFPIPLIITWAFELTPEGFKTTKVARKVATPPSGKEQRKRNLLAMGFAAGVPTLLFGALALFFFLRSGPDPVPSPASGESREQSSVTAVAVMPLSNMSSDEENGYFAGGVHEEILTNLSRIKNVKVISRTTMLRYAASNLRLPEIGKELKVRYIVEGSVRKIGNHVRVTIQLIDAENDHHLWAQNYERELIDVFATQSEIAKEISNSLHLEIQPETIGRLVNMPTTSVRAYDLYIKANDISKTEMPSNENAIRRLAMLEEAVELDPEFVEAWAQLSQTYNWELKNARDRGDYIEEVADREAYLKTLEQKLDRALAKAQALGPDNVETRIATAVHYNFQSGSGGSKKAQEILEAIIEQYPDNAEAIILRTYALPTGDERRLALMEKALELAPFNASIVRAAVGSYSFHGDEENAARLKARLEQIVPESSEDRYKERMSTFGKTFRLREAFIHTAGETELENYANLLNELDEETAGYRTGIERNIYSFTGRNDRIKEMAEQHAELISEHTLEIKDYFDLQSSALSVHLLEGDVDHVKRIAHRLVAVGEQAQVQNLLLIDHNIIREMAEAHYHLGEMEEMQFYLDKLLDKTDEEYVPGQAVSVLMFIDPDRAVEMALREKAENPSSLIMDWAAAYHVNERAFVVHPKIQAYYVKEGKWLGYLSKYVPEYAKYKTE